MPYYDEINLIRLELGRWSQDTGQCRHPRFNTSRARQSSHVARLRHHLGNVRQALFKST